MPRLLVALLLALSGVVLTQMPAHAACTCVKNDTPAHIKNATTVLLGKVTSSARDGKTLTYDVQVERVYKGVAATSVTLESPSTKRACALDNLVADRRYVVFGTQQGDVVEVNSCGGTAPTTDRLLTVVTGALGAGTSPESATGRTTDGGHVHPGRRHEPDQVPAARCARCRPGDHRAARAAVPAARRSGALNDRYRIHPAARTRLRRFLLLPGAPSAAGGCGIIPGGRALRICSSWARAAICWA